MSLRELKRVTVRVTQEDIDAGHPSDSEACPIALALQRTFPRARKIAVGKPTVFLGGVEWMLDPAAVRFVDRFDSHLPVAPLKVTLVKEG